jgi:hypothetical protein
MVASLKKNVVAVSRKKENDKKKKPNLLQLKRGDLEHPSPMGQKRLSEGMMCGPSTQPLVIAGHGLDDMPDPSDQRKVGVSVEMLAFPLRFRRLKPVP